MATNGSRWQSLIIREAAGIRNFSKNVERKGLTGQLSRRHFFLGIGGSLAALATLRGWQVFGTPENGYFRYPEALYRLGRQLLASGTDFARSSDTAPDLEQAHLQDLQQGNVMIVDGWVVSRSEAETCLDYARATSRPEVKNNAG